MRNFSETTSTTGNEKPVPNDIEITEPIPVTPAAYELYPDPRMKDRQMAEWLFTWSTILFSICVYVMMAAATNSYYKNLDYRHFPLFITANILGIIVLESYLWSTQGKVLLRIALLVLIWVIPAFIFSKVVWTDVHVLTKVFTGMGSNFATYIGAHLLQDRYSRYKER